MLGKSAIADRQTSNVNTRCRNQPMVNLKSAI